MGNTLVVADLIREIRPLQDFRAFVELCRLLKKIKHAPPSGAPVIVHTHSSKAGIIGRWAARCSAVPTVIHSIHGFAIHEQQPWWYENFLLSLKGSPPASLPGLLPFQRRTKRWESRCIFFLPILPLLFAVALLSRSSSTPASRRHSPL